MGLGVVIPKLRLDKVKAGPVENGVSALPPNERVHETHSEVRPQPRSSTNKSVGHSRVPRSISERGLC